MSDSSFSKKIISQFPLNSKKDWTEAAKQELDGADASEKLKKRVGEIEISPYYDPDDRVQGDFQLPLSRNEYLGARCWFNSPVIDATNAKDANLLALDSLRAGADGILFDLRGRPDAGTLLKKIELPYCSISFLTAGGHEEFFEQFIALVKARNYDPSTISGAIFWQSASVDPNFIEKFAEWANFHPLGIRQSEFSSAPDGIATLLADAVRQIDALPSRIKINNALKTVAFSVLVGSDFFLEITRLKALRLLWTRVSRVFDPQFSVPVMIHAQTVSWKNESYEPHGNLIHSTTAAMSAILGGCDALSVLPGSEQSEMLTRVSRNVSSILREESHLNKVADPTAGSFYVDSLTTQLVKIAWEKFQQLVK